jgi:hypothetical protein
VEFSVSTIVDIAQREDSISFPLGPGRSLHIIE